MKNLIIKNKGFMMVEILVAVSIISVLTISMMAVVQNGISVSRQSLHTIQAAFLLEEGAESVRIIRDNSWNNISSLSTSEDTDYYLTFSGGTWNLSLTPNQVDSFIRVVNISTVNRDATTGSISEGGVLDSGTRLITINVSWLENGETKSKSLSFYISNIFS